jgi:hypothetical protein
MQSQDHDRGTRRFAPSPVLRVLGLILLAIPAFAAFPFVKKVSYTSSYLDTAGRADFLIYLPPGYETSGLRYSTIFYLHGSTDNAYTDTCQAGILDRLIAAKQVNPMIVVYLNVTHSGGYRDRGPGDMQESFIIKDIIPHIDKTYRTLGTPEGRALDGFSMGAAGSLRLAFTYPKLFTSAMSWDGGATSADIAAQVEANAADIKGRFDVRIYSRPLTAPALVTDALKKLGVPTEHIIVDTDHVGVLGESGPTNKRVCHDPTRVTAGWKFFSTVLAEPSSAVSAQRTGSDLAFDSRTGRLGDFRIYSPSGKYLGGITSRDQLPGRGLYLVQSREFPGRKKLVYLD